MAGCVGRALAASARHGKALLAVAITIGVVAPHAAHALHPAVPAAGGAVSTLVLLRVDVPATLRHLRHPVRLALVMAVQMALCPVLAWAVMRAAPVKPVLADAVVLFATGSPLVSAPAYARLLGLDAELAL